MISAEWICTRCGTTNRRLLKPGDERKDKCMSCRLPHQIEPGTRPVRWQATPLK